MTKEIRISGFGGQGVILTAYIIGKAASLYDGKESSLIQSFGPEARGSSCSAQLIISDEKILYPYIAGTDILVAMSQSALAKFFSEVKKDGVVIYENELVDAKNISTLGIPATRLSEEEFGKSFYSNVIMVGYITAVTGIIKLGSAEEAVRTSVPSHTVENNLKALETGYNFAKNHA